MFWYSFQQDPVKLDFCIFTITTTCFHGKKKKKITANSVPKLFFNHFGAPGIWPYIQEVRDLVCDLESRLQRIKDNVEEMQSCMRSWAMPVFDRKDGRKDALLSLDDRAERLDKFYCLIRSSGEKIHFLLKVGEKKKKFGFCILGTDFEVSLMFHHSTRLSCNQQFLIRFENPTVTFKHECDISSCLRETSSFSEQRLTQRSGRPTWSTLTIWSSMDSSTALSAHFASSWITLVMCC